MLRGSENIHDVESIKLKPIRREVRADGREYWHRDIEIGGGHLSWKDISLFAATREALMMDHEKAAEAAKVAKYGPGFTPTVETAIDAQAAAEF